MLISKLKNNILSLPHYYLVSHVYHHPLTPCITTIANVTVTIYCCVPVKFVYSSYNLSNDF